MKKNKTERATILMNTIESIINKAVSRLSYNTKRKGVIQSINGDNTVDVSVNDEVYQNIKVRPGVILQVNDVVWVEKPNNVWKEAFVDFKIN